MHQDPASDKGHGKCAAATLHHQNGCVDLNPPTLWHHSGNNFCRKHSILIAGFTPQAMTSHLPIRPSGTGGVMNVMVSCVTKQTEDGTVIVFHRVDKAPDSAAG